MKISIITVTYNSSHILTEFIDQLRLNGQDESELIIVDSGSDDAEATKIIAQRKGATVVLSPENIGYGRGSNLGAARAQGEWLVFVNPDVSVIHDQLVELVRIGQRNEVHCIGPQVAGIDGRLKVSWGRTIRPPWRKRGSGYTDHGSLIHAETISGCCMAISAEHFRRLNGFDPSFFMFCEEMDLHRRLLDLNGRISVARDVVVRTPGGSSSLGVTDRWRSVERLIGHTRYVFKHFSRVEGCAAIGYNLLKIIFLPKFKRRRTSFVQYSKGLRRNVAGT